MSPSLLNRLAPAQRNDLTAALFYAVPVGLAVGLGISLYDAVVNQWLWGTFSAHVPPAFLAFLPFVGMVLAGSLLRLFGHGDPTMADEVVRAYHGEPHELAAPRSAVKLAASVLTMGFGASAGMEGACKWAGGVIGSGVHRGLGRLPFYRNRSCPWRLVMLTGAAAGIAAIFRAPLTGAIMGVESPFRKDLAHEALVPSLVAAALSFGVFRALRDATPYFPVGFASTYAFAWHDALGALFLGMAAGLCSHAFLSLLRATKAWHAGRGFPHVGVYAAAGAALAFLAWLSRDALGEAVTLQSGLDVARQLLRAPSPWTVAALILGAKLLATVITFGCGGVGGLFLPSATIGAALGAVFESLWGAPAPGFFVFLGIAAFTGASYNSLIFACVFIAEASGSAALMAPGLVAVTAAYLVSLGVSNSAAQRWDRAPLDPT